MNQYFDYIKRKVDELADKYGVNPALIMAIIKHESNFNPSAYNPRTGDYGLMQINAKAHPDFDINRAYDIDYNLEYGVKFLRKLIDKWGPTHGIEGIISAYNAGHPTFRNYWSYVVPVLKNFGYFLLNEMIGGTV